MGWMERETGGMLDDVLCMQKKKKMLTLALRSIMNSERCDDKKVWVRDGSDLSARRNNS